MKILTISLNAWNDTMATGNTFSNFFQNLGPQDRIANIFCREEPVNNNVCHLYYKVTEKDQIKNFWRKNNCGNEFEVHIQQQFQASILQKNNSRLKQSINRSLQLYRPGLLLFFREFLWALNIWKSERLKAFLREFNPDVIYMHGHNNIYMHKLLWYCQHITGAKVAIYFGDDMYNYKGERFIKHLYHKIYQRQLGFTINHADILFGGSPKLVSEYGSIFGKKFNLLIKCCDNIGGSQPRYISYPITLMYAGNLLYGRDKCLVDVVNVIKSINEEKSIFQLHVYTATYTNNETTACLNDCKNSFLHASKPFSEICKLLNETDLALFVESFNYNYKKQTRLSFSTKIIDYFQSNSAILSYGPLDVSSIDYLNRSNVSFVASSIQELKNILIQIKNNPSQINDMMKRKYDYALKYHTTPTLVDGLRELRIN
ncbi:MAG: hypothetical protein RR202_05990 [Bacteroidales bacterium]